MRLAYHPLANLFPLIEGEELTELVADLRTNGLREKISYLDDAILDGRNRYRALLAAGLLDPEDGFEVSRYFVKFLPEIDGDPLKFVLSKNLRRRHLDERQRASIAGKIANLDRGGDRSKPPIGGLPVEKAAEALNVAPRQAERARVVHQHGVDEVREALDRGDVAVSVAEKIARMPEEAQPAELARHLPNGARAIMGSRQEPDDSLDYFPTPPWATRALLEHVLPQYASWNSSVWEPACGEGHIAEVLAERFREVIATDIHDYGYGGVQDFLTCQVPEKIPDWIITNPPFGDKAEAFVLHALQHARVGAAMFLRLQWLETVGRYERIFKPHPPTMIAQFAERVPLHKGRWEHDGDTATAYLWIVWSKISSGRGTEFFWIPPGCRDTFQLEDDVARFTAHPVIKRVRAADDGTPCNPETGEIIEPVDSKKPDQSISDDHYCDNNRPNKDQDADKTQGATSSLCGGPIVARSTGNSELNRSAASDNLEIPAFLKRAKDNQLPGGPA